MAMSMWQSAFVVVLAVYWALFRRTRDEVDDIFLWIKVQDRCWHINVANFKRRSEAFDNMFMVPQPKWSWEGHLKHMPIEIGGVLAVDFEWLISYMHGDDYHQRTRYTTDGLIAILKLSHLYNIPDARRFAIKGLDPLYTISPILRLHLAITYEVPRWFRVSISKVLSIPLYQYTPNDLAILDSHLLFDLVEERRKIEESRMQLLLAPYPYIQADECTSSEECREIWDSQWLSLKASMIPGEPDGLSPSQVRRKVKRCEGFTEMCEHCYTVSSHPIVTRAGWARETNLTRAAAGSLFNKYIIVESDSE